MKPLIYWASIIAVAILLGIVFTDTPLLAHLFLRGGWHSASTWERLSHGNWPLLLSWSYLIAAVTYGELALIDRSLSFRRLRLLAPLIAVLVLVGTLIVAKGQFDSLLGGAGHWRYHCFGVCQLPPDEGLTIQALSVVASIVAFLSRFMSRSGAAPPATAEP
jgi:hypothetical protein